MGAGQDCMGYSIVQRGIPHRRLAACVLSSLGRCNCRLLHRLDSDRDCLNAPRQPLSIRLRRRAEPLPNCKEPLGNKHCPQRKTTTRTRNYWPIALRRILEGLNARRLQPTPKGATLSLRIDAVPDPRGCCNRSLIWLCPHGRLLSFAMYLLASDCKQRVQIRRFIDRYSVNCWRGSCCYRKVSIRRYQIPERLSQ